MTKSNKSNILNQIFLHHLVHVERPEHLLDVGAGLGVQTSQPEELLELVQGELT